MTARRLWQLVVSVSPEAEEAVAVLLERLWARPPVVQMDAQSGRRTVSVFLEQRREWTAAQQAALQAGLAQVRQAGLDLGPGRVELRPIRREDWAESWKRHFPPLTIGQALLVKPPWSRQRSRPGQAVVRLNPGLSFGTGQHPTTRFCLEQLVAVRKRDTCQSFLDIGCGSGILAIAAAKLGYRPVEGLDCDPEAVRVARANARQNRVRVRLRHEDLARLSPRSRRRYTVICANLTAEVLAAQRARIVNRLSRDGCLVLAGVLRSQFTTIRRLYQAAGLALAAYDAAGEWASGVFVWPPRPAPQRNRTGNKAGKQKGRAMARPLKTSGFAGTSRCLPGPNPPIG